MLAKLIEMLVLTALSAAAPAENTINLALEAEPRTIDPRFALDANSQYLENLIHCALIDFDPEGRPIGDLAQSWSWTSDKALTVRIKSGIKFSDGSPVTARDIKATYDSLRNKNAKNPSPRHTAFSKLKAVKMISDFELSFELEEPDASFATNLVLGILPEATIQRFDMLSLNQPIIGCGPFLLKSASSSQIELAKNPVYTLSTPAKTDFITIKIVKDETTRFAKLQAGELDIVQNAIARDKLTDIAKKSPNLKVLRRTGLNTVYLGFNMRDPIAGNPLVRKAISRAIDREKIIKYILNGLATPAKSLLPKTSPFYTEPPLVSLNYDEAKKLLDDAGFKDPDGEGKTPRFTMTYKTTTDQTRISIAKAIAADLKKIGIAVTVESLEWGRFKADVEAGKVQMWSLQWIGFKDPDIYRFAFGSESFPPNGGNRGFYSNSKLDLLLQKGRKETNQEKRIPVYQEVQKLIDEDLPYIFLWHEESFAVLNSRIEGFELYADGRFASLKTAYRK